MNCRIFVVKTILISTLMLLLPVTAFSQQPAERQPLFTLDEQVWVLFYDLPSRRFRTIRDAFVRRDFAAAQKDLEVTHGFLLAEIGRSEAVLRGPLTEVADRLLEISAEIESPETTVRNLDAVFARGHWLLAQHYLILATRGRDSAQHSNAGSYLWATAHHLERAVLWSDARLTPAQVRALDDIRAMADRLRTDAKPERVYRDKPIAKARDILVKLGDYLDRKVWIDAPR